MKKCMWSFLLLCVVMFPLPSMPMETVPLTVAEVSPIQTYVPVKRYWSASQYYGVIGDLDNDNVTEEVIWANGSRVHAYNASGMHLWSQSLAVSYPIIGDFDRDGYTDDIYDNPNRIVGGGMAYNKSAYPILNAINGSIHYANFTCSNSVYGVADFNGDGYADDLVFERGNGTFGYPMISAFSYANPTVTYWNFSLGYTAPHTNVAGGLLLGDINLDGDPRDVVVTTLMNWTYAINSSGGLIWAVNVGYASNPKPMRSDLILIDLDRDGVLSDVIVNSYWEQKVIAINHTGHILWNFTTKDETATMVAGDFDRDGYFDNLAVATEFSGSLGGIAILNSSGGLIWNHSINSYISYLAVADVDGSGFQDNVIVSSTPCLVFDFQGNVIGRGGDTGRLFHSDFDGDGFLDDLIIGSYDLTLYRLGTPNVTCTLLAPPPLEFETGARYIHFTLTNYEGFALDIGCTASVPGASQTWYLNDQDVPAGNTSSYFLLQLSPGTYNLTIQLAHEGEVFQEIQVTLTVTAAPPIGVPLWGWLIAIFLLFGCVYRIQKRREDFSFFSFVRLSNLNSRWKKKGEIRTLPL